MQWGLHERKLAPTEFWRSTLRELLPRTRVTPGAVLRQNLNALMGQFPD